MGDRCVIATEKRDIGIYLHWAGGRVYVESFLAYARMRGIRPPEEDNYGWARLCQIVGNAIQGDLGIGIGLYDDLDRDNGDNGLYVIRGWRVVGREFFSGEECGRGPDEELLVRIDLGQPAQDRVGYEAIGKWMRNPANL